MEKAHLAFKVIDQTTDTRSGDLRREERFGETLRVTSTGQLEIRTGTNGRSLTTSRRGAVRSVEVVRAEEVPAIQPVVAVTSPSTPGIDDT